MAVLLHALLIHGASALVCVLFVSTVLACVVWRCLPRTFSSLAIRPGPAFQRQLAEQAHLSFHHCHLLHTQDACGYYFAVQMDVS